MSCDITVHTPVIYLLYDITSNLFANKTHVIMIILLTLASCLACNGHVILVSCNYINYILDVMGM
jgi:hypothetical protein